MLFTENDLNYVNALDLLEEATYLSEDESIINPATIPVKEVKRLGYGVVRFDDVDKLSEDYGILNTLQYLYLKKILLLILRLLMN